MNAGERIRVQQALSPISTRTTEGVYEGQEACPITHRVCLNVRVSWCQTRLIDPATITDIQRLH